MEQYFARSLGFSQLAVGLLIVVLTGSLPLASPLDCMFCPRAFCFLNPGVPDVAIVAPADAISPYASAAVSISMLYHASAAFYGYVRFTSSQQMGYLLGCLGSSTLAMFGLWVMMFAGEKGRISKRTGADKRTSGWPFKNTEADKRKS